MKDKRDQGKLGVTIEEINFSKSIQKWMAQDDEDFDFLCGKVSNFLPEFTEEE
jgi:hypothetical protein